MILISTAEFSWLITDTTLYGLKAKYLKDCLLPHKSACPQYSMYLRTYDWVALIAAF